MKLLAIGVSHRTAPLEVRERFSFTRKRLEEGLKTLKNSGLVGSAVALSTCNRTEVYVHRDEEVLPQRTIPLILQLFNAAPEEVDRYFYMLRNRNAARHIFRVAAGLDSQVLGETQILSQVGTAWRTAKDIGATDPFLDELFTAAQEAGRLIRSETKISQGNVSIGSVAIKMLEENFTDLQKRPILIIGAGKISGLISKYLREKRINGIFVASRTYKKALEMAAECGGRAVDFSQLEQEIKNADIVISATSSPHIVLKKEMLERIMRTRERGIFIMDLALPRDVDPCVRDIAGVILRDLDDLKYVMEENHRKRFKEAVIAEKIIERELDRLWILKRPSLSHS